MFSLSKVVSFRDIVIVIASVLVTDGDTEEFRGRHVCNQQRTVTQYVPVQQSYTRAVYSSEHQGMTYQTAYRTVFKIQIRTEVVPGCCPGWNKRQPRDVNCIKPVCKEKCENGGECLGPDLCVCAEGYTGLSCQLDIDECSGRNSCQQKCSNLPGSYECSCQEGFKLANDKTTCELCLNCTREFQQLQTQIDSMQADTRNDTVLEDIQKQSQEIDLIKTQLTKFMDIQQQLDSLHKVFLADNKFQALRKQVNVIENKITDLDTIKVINKNLEALQEIVVRKEELVKIQEEIEILKPLKEEMKSVRSLKGIVRRLQDDKAQKSIFKDIQQQVEGMQTAKVEQEKSQTERFEAVHRKLDQLEELKDKLDSFKEMKHQLEEMRSRIEELETDKAILKSNLATAVTQYEAAISAMEAKEVTKEHLPTDPFESGSSMPLDRLASLSEQISLLEEKMADCACNQDYIRG